MPRYNRAEGRSMTVLRVASTATMNTRYEHDNYEHGNEDGFAI